MVDIQEIKRISIVDFCNSNGIAIKKDSKEYYRLVEHDSLVINDRKNLFMWNSQNKGGDIIDFVRTYYDCSFVEAKNKLAGVSDYDFKRREVFINSKPKIDEPKEPYEYDISQECKVNAARKYLVEKRKINPKLVDTLIDKGLIRQDNKSNVLFLWSNSKKIVGCTEQGTRPFYNPKKSKMQTWKKIQENGKQDYGFNFKIGKGENLFFYESEIDMLSYISINPQKYENAHFISMNGLKIQTVVNFVNEKYKETGNVPKSITICTDNDKAGWKFYNNQFNKEALKENGIDNSIKIKSDIPTKEGYDWNDVIKERSSKRFEGITENQLDKILNNTKQISANFELE